MQMPAEQEYLVGYGPQGAFGRFRPAGPLDCGRGDAVVVRSPRGVELGRVLRRATPGHAALLDAMPPGDLLRLASAEDEDAAERLFQRGRDFFDEARRRADDLGLPLEVLDAEVLLDNDHAVLHFVRWSDCDVRELVAGLSKHFTVHVLLQDLTRPEEHGCGSCGEGGCGSCGTGGCGSGSCSAASAAEVREYFAGLREQMLAHNRTPLL